MSDFIRAKKSLGQNFLKDPHYLGKIVDAAAVGPEDNVIEIGPGLGDLTRVLADRAKRVVALELDDRLIPRLLDNFRGSGHVEIVHADALQYPYDQLTGTWKAVGNLPYYISTPLIQRLLAARRPFSRMTLMLQKEVAERIAAGPGGKEYGYLSVLVQLFARPRIEFLVPPGAFSPRPKVESAVITLVLRDAPAISLADEDHFFRVVKAAFSQRRKTLRNSLRRLEHSAGSMAALHERTGIDPGRRAETLSVEEFGRLADFFRS